MFGVKNTMVAVSLIALSSVSFSATGLNVDNRAMGSAGDDFIRTISGKIQSMNYLVNLRRNTQDYFDVLNLLVYLNQSSQLEKKMDVLIGEMRRNNQLLERVLMETWLDSSIHIMLKVYELVFIILPEKPKKQQIKQPIILTTHKLNWQPAPNHPWRRYGKK